VPSLGGFEVDRRVGLFRLFGDLDTFTVPLLEAALEDAIDVGGPIVLDVTELGFIDSAGVRTLIRTAKALRSACLIVHGTHDQVEKVLDITGIERAENIHVTACTYEHTH
jgi:anti-anti-sigma factor